MLSASAFGSADNSYLDLDYSGYHKTSSNNCYNRKPQVISGWCVCVCGGHPLHPPPRSAPDLVLLTYRLIILVHPTTT